MKNFTYLFFALLVIGFTQCSESEFEDRASTIDTSAFPLAMGNEWVYQVDYYEVSRGGQIKEQKSSQVKEVITREIKNNDEQKIYQLSRFHRDNASKPWVEREQYQIGIDGRIAFKVVNNFKEIKLSFPLKAGKTWDAHTYISNPRQKITFGNNSYEYYKNWKPSIVSVDGTMDNYTGVTEVNYVDINNLFEYENATEKYSKGIGMIYSKVEYLRVISPDADTRPWAEKTDIGFRITQTLISSKIN